MPSHRTVVAVLAAADVAELIAACPRLRRIVKVAEHARTQERRRARPSLAFTRAG